MSRIKITNNGPEPLMITKRQSGASVEFFRPQQILNAGEYVEVDVDELNHILIVQATLDIPSLTDTLNTSGGLNSGVMISNGANGTEQPTPAPIVIDENLNAYTLEWDAGKLIIHG